MTKLAVRALLVASTLAVLIFAAVNFFYGVSHADVSARCWAHLAEIPAGQKTTAAGDVRYHRERGQFSPCNEQEAAEADSASSSDNRPRRDDPGYHCKLTFRGVKCG